MAAARLVRSSVFRLTAAAVATLGILAAAAVAIIGWHANASLTRATEAAILSDARDLRRTFETAGFEGLRTAVDLRSRLMPGSVYFLMDPDGSRKSGNILKEPDRARTGHGAGVFQYAEGSSAGERTAAGLIVSLDGGGLLVVGRDIEEQRALLTAIKRDLILGLGGLAIAGIVGGLLLARHILGRIDAMARASETIMAGNLSKRLPKLGSDDELDRLADQLNAMLARIERLMAGLREVSDNIAHDLKTPLNRLRNRAEAALADQREGIAWREGLERTIEEADDIIKTFNALLLIARLEAGAVEEQAEILDLADIVRDVAELYEPAAEDAGFHLALQIASAAPISANRHLVGQAIANLVDNAIKYSQRSSARASDRVIRLTIAPRASMVEVTVADRGPGIPAADRGRALRRFVRLDSSRSRPGTGLGLSLVAAVVQMHKGEIKLEDNAPGLRVVLTFPKARPSSGCTVADDKTLTAREVAE